MPQPTVSNLITKPLTVILVLAVAFATLATVAEAQRPGESRTVALQISTPDGDFYVNLLGETDDLVRIPVASELADAIQIFTKFVEGDGLRVVLHSVIDDLTIEPLAQYELPLPEGSQLVTRNYFLRLPMDQETIPLKHQQTEPIEFHELASLNLEGWTFRVTFFPPFQKGNCACCSCESLYCCPHAGSCMGCGSCGDCCCTDGGNCRVVAGEVICEENQD